MRSCGARRDQTAVRSCTLPGHIPIRTPLTSRPACRARLDGESVSPRSRRAGLYRRRSHPCRASDEQLREVPTDTLRSQCLRRRRCVRDLRALRARSTSLVRLRCGVRAGARTDARRLPARRPLLAGGAEGRCRIAPFVSGTTTVRPALVATRTSTTRRSGSSLADGLLKMARSSSNSTSLQTLDNLGSLYGTQRVLSAPAAVWDERPYIDDWPDLRVCRASAI